MILAPLTRGGNLPFRRLCCDFGCKVSMGEMIFARYLLQNDPVERARLRRSSNEHCFGVQIATNDAEEGVAAMKLAREAGADFVDLNCGCPINEATRRGLGSALLRNPKKLGDLVERMTRGTPDIPLTVKIRLGTSDNCINVLDVADHVTAAGAAALTIHGRSAMERYSSAADWEKIEEVKNAVGSRIKVIGNGDIVSYAEGQRRIATSGVDGVMVGRGALESPWIFDENGWEPDAAQRVNIYRRLAVYMKEHFGDDARGKRMASYFLPWHFEFLCRHRPGKVSLQDRLSEFDDMPPLESLLACKNPAAHKRIADILWESGADTDAKSSLFEFAESKTFSDIQNNQYTPTNPLAELANIPKEDKKVRKRKAPKPKRTQDEIDKVRAERKAKREAAGITDFKHDDGKRRS
ncbi:hypothetical protein TrVE_jg13491 [Triparma verrucosa]|uniref:tRNA-dihydrouridine(47) synthase [NAD(P)(+)] n=1 Tax=Triparma verrucosa TaxID=1606542 RepID=A0A9W7BFM8_9STRA|nr:hypothetical protein TrVE_jg13491 [Triparma verrucosa]